MKQSQVNIGPGGIRLAESTGNIAVGGVVLDKERAIIAKKGHGPLQGFWMIPGGGIKSGETLDGAIRREVEEETGVSTSVRGIIAVRSRVLEDGHADVYVAFLLERTAGETRPDGREITEVRSVNLEELQQLEPVTEFSRYLIRLVLTQKVQLLGPTGFLPFDFPKVAGSKYILFA